MSFFFSKENKEEIVALFDIGSGSVGGAMIVTSPQNKPIILFSARIPFKVNGSWSIFDVSQNMLRALDQVALLIQKGSHEVPDKVYAVLSSPWAHASFRVLKRKHKESFVFTQKYAKDLIEEEIKDFMKEESDYNELIDRRTVNVLLNGFSVENPNGKRVKEVEIDLFLSLAIGDVVESIENVIMKTYKRNIKFTSQMFSDFVVVRDIFDKLDDFIIINVDEETTEVSIMINDLLSGAVFFPFGSDTMLRAVAKKLAKSEGETKSILKMRNMGHLGDHYDRRVEQAIQEAGLEWIGHLKKVLRGFVSDLHIPRNIYIITDGSVSEQFFQLLDKKFFPEFTTTENSFNVIIGDSRVLHEFCSFSKDSKSDSNLTMQSIFIANVERAK